MTLAPSGTEETSNDTASPFGDDGAPKTMFDCDIVTLTRCAHDQEDAAKRKMLGKVDPLEALYRPLGNKDVQTVLMNTRASA